MNEKLSNKALLKDTQLIILRFFPLLVLALLGCTSLPHLVTNDDMVINMVVSNFFCDTEAASMPIYTHHVLASFFNSLYSYHSTINWYPVIYIGLMCLCGLCLSWILTTKSMSTGHRLIITVIVISFIFPFIINLTYTRVAFILGATGIAILFKRASTTQLVIGYLLITLSAFIRIEPMIGIMASISAILFWRFFSKKSFKELLVLLFPVAILYAVQTADSHFYSQNGYPNFFEKSKSYWKIVNIPVIPGGYLDNLEKINWGLLEYKLITSYNNYDGDVFTSDKIIDITKNVIPMNSLDKAITELWNVLNNQKQNISLISLLFILVFTSFRLKDYKWVYCYFVTIIILFIYLMMFKKLNSTAVILLTISAIPIILNQPDLKENKLTRLHYLVVFGVILNLGYIAYFNGIRNKNTVDNITPSLEVISKNKDNTYVILNGPLVGLDKIPLDYSINKLNSNFIMGGWLINSPPWNDFFAKRDITKLATQIVDNPKLILISPDIDNLTLFYEKFYNLKVEFIQITNSEEMELLGLDEQYIIRTIQET